jgi:hypothetical protein
MASCLLSQPPTGQQTEKEQVLIQRYAKTDVRQFSFSVRAVESWEKLPEELKNAKNS